MSADGDADVTEALQQLQTFNSAYEDEKHRAKTESFSATDESGTVTIVVNGDRWLTDLRIEHGLLRLGAETVQQRINEALRKAQADAFAVAHDQVQQLEDTLADLANTLQDQLGDFLPRTQ